MRRSISIVGLAIAWLCANGVLLDVAQVVAWGRMFSNYARVLPIGEAVSRTFDADKPCELCRMIRKAKAAEANRRRSPTHAPDSPTTLKMMLVQERTELALIAQPAIAWKPRDYVSSLGPVKAVPVPPPRRAHCLAFA